MRLLDLRCVEIPGRWGGDGGLDEQEAGFFTSAGLDQEAPQSLGGCQGLLGIFQGGDLPVLDLDDHVPHPQARFARRRPARDEAHDGAIGSRKPPLPCDVLGDLLHVKPEVALELGWIALFTLAVAAIAMLRYRRTLD